MTHGWTTVRARDPERLSPRERQCVVLEREGHTRQTIALRLGISVVTVAGHIWRAGLSGAWLRRPIANYTGHSKTANYRRKRKARLAAGQSR